VNPNEPIALNNLAYALAVRKGQAAEAIGYAERAHTITRGNATIADTLAWIQHLLGRDREAAPLLAGAVKALPGNAEVRLHAAVVYAAIGMLEPAAKELQEALRLDPALAKSDEVKALEGKLRATQAGQERHIVEQDLKLEQAGEALQTEIRRGQGGQDAGSPAGSAPGKRTKP